MTVGAAARQLGRRLDVYGHLDEAQALADLERVLGSPERAQDALGLALVRRLAVRRGDQLIRPADWRHHP